MLSFFDRFRGITLHYLLRVMHPPNIVKSSHSHYKVPTNTPTFRNELPTRSLTGPRAVVDAHSVLRGGNMQAAATIVAGSVTVNGQILKVGGVYGGRPPKKLVGECWEL